MAKAFYYQVMGEVIGPVSDVELRQKALDQDVTQDTFVRVGADGNWVAANRLKGFFDENGNPIPHPVSEPQSLDHKTCPYCAESIMATAIKCRYCGEFLEGARPTPTPDSPLTPPDGSRLRSCPDCGHQVSKHAQQCPSCGRPFEGPLQERTPTPASTTAPPTTSAPASATAPSSIKPEEDGPVKVNPRNEVTDGVRVGLIVLTILCWLVVIVLFASNPERNALWFMPVLITAIVCGILGSVIGSFKNASDIGGLLGATFGPLGVIGVLAIDGRLQCPKCGGRLDGKPEVCPHCHVRLAFPNEDGRQSGPVFECPVCSAPLTGQPDKCTHCSSAIPEATRKFSPALLKLIDSKGPIAIGIEATDFHAALYELKNLAFKKHDPRSFIVQFFSFEVRGYIDASRLRELSVIPYVSHVRCL